MSMNNQELLLQRQKGVYQEFTWECDPKLSLTIKMPNPKEYDEAMKKFRAKNSSMALKAMGGRTEEQLKNLTEEETKEISEHANELFTVVDEIENLSLSFFEKGMPNDWKLENLTFEEYAELKKRVQVFFDPAKKSGGTMPTTQSGETV